MRNDFKKLLMDADNQNTPYPVSAAMMYKDDFLEAINHLGLTKKHEIGLFLSVLEYIIMVEDV